MTDAEIKIKGMKILVSELGELDAERFVTLVSREAFDYTVWQRSLWETNTVSDISKAAMEYYKKKK